MAGQTLLLIILVVVLLFFFLREFWCWYFKINEIRDILVSIEKNTSVRPVSKSETASATLENKKPAESDTRGAFDKWWNGPKQ